MDGTNIRILLVEDNPGDAHLVQWCLTRPDPSRFVISHVVRLNEALSLVTETTFDVILLDLSLPDSTGLATVRKMRAGVAGIPILIMTGLDDEDTALTALREGAQDYLVKGHFDSMLLLRAISYAVERQRLVEELATKNKELAELNDLKNQFLGMAAHDLRNPLSVILATSSFLLEDAGRTMSENKRIDFLRRINANSKFMLGLIDELLDVAKIESGRLELNLQETDIAALVEDNVALNNMLAAKKGIVLEFVRPPALPRVRFDRTRIEQVFNNLVSNALKFSRPGTKV
ncbi:MAG: HAMP domain-containing sensor histidine kinase, partial [candidate division WOR-3 bacterium]